MTADPILCAIDAAAGALRSRANAHWIVAFSGGKDSTSALKILLAAYRQSSLRYLNLTVIYCDTGVENPILDLYAKSVLRRLNDELKEFGPSFKTRLLKAPVQDRFFVRIIGRGYPPPTNSFRWCTTGLRIRPVSRFIEAEDPTNTVVVLGLRRSESLQRDRTLNIAPDGSWQKQREGRKDYDLFLPILDLNVAEVWDSIFWLSRPRSVDPKVLEELYRDASGECPVIRAPQSPPCASGRFGCWTCTVVRQDKSAKKLIEAGYSELKPYFEFRAWLSEIRNDPAMRWPHRRNGASGMGPFTLDARREILKRLNQLEVVTKTEILDWEERGAIAALWQLDHYPRLSFQVS